MLYAVVLVVVLAVVWWVATSRGNLRGHLPSYARTSPGEGELARMVCARIISREDKLRRIGAIADAMLEDGEEDDEIVGAMLEIDTDGADDEAWFNSLDLARAADMSMSTMVSKGIEQAAAVIWALDRGDADMAYLILNDARGPMGQSAWFAKQKKKKKKARAKRASRKPRRASEER